MYAIDKSKVKKYMRRSGIHTQKKLAEKLDISENQMSMLLSSKYNPIKSNAMKLCETLHVELDEITEQLEFDLGIDEKMAVKSTAKKKQQYDDRDFIDIRGIKPVNKYKVLELFAGAGGLALGLEQAGFDAVGLVEIDKHACKTLKSNRPKWNVIEKDIVEIANKGIENYVDGAVGELDLLSGGYPCQAFSYAGKKGGLEDVRGTLFYHYASILKQLKPKMFLAENVRGLVNHDGGKTLQIMLDVFSEVGYQVKWKILRALDYDVAQKRERIVIVGIRNDLIHGNNVDLEYKFPKPFGYELTLKDVLRDVPKSEGAKYPESKRQVLELVPPGGYWRDLPEKIAKEYMGKSYYSGGGRTGMARRLSWNEPSLTLTCSPAQKQTERCHPDETRPFTIREYARIQSFPDDWLFEGSVANTYTQIGNAVPVQMAKAIGLSLVNILNRMN